MHALAIHYLSARFRSCCKRVGKYASVPVLAACATLAAAQTAGVADPAWTISDTGRIVMTAFAVQPDGRIVATGYDPSEGNRQFVTLRFNTDGTPDTAFGTQGRTKTQLGVHDAAAGDIEIAADGSIYVVGKSTAEVNSGSGIAIVRYRADGSLDPTFAGDGSLEYKPQGADRFDAGGGLGGPLFALLPDGKLLIAGARTLFTDTGTSVSTPALLRLDDDGSPDPAFGSNGQVILNDAERFRSITSLRVADDGSIFLAGFGGPQTQPHGRLVKLTPDGALDTSFAAGGVYSPVANDDMYYDAAVQADGRIIVVGQQIQGTFSDPDYRVGVIVARLNADGSPDTTFGTAGTRFVELGPRGDYATSVAIDAAGRILVTGIVRSLGAFYASPFLLRLTPSGSIDGSFGNGGIITPAGKAAFFLESDSDGAVFLLGTEATLLALDATTFIQKILTDDPALSLLPRIDSYSSAGAMRNSEFAIGVRGGDGVLTSEARAGYTLAINGYIFPQDADEEAIADIFIVAVAPTGWFMRNLDGQFEPWNTRIADLAPAYERVPLLNPLPVELYSGTLAIQGAYGLYLGYMRTDSAELVYTFSAAPLQITAP